MNQETSSLYFRRSNDQSELGMTAMHSESDNKFVIREYDVVCGRNKIAHAHYGNNFFRQLVNDYGSEYQHTIRREEKKRITLTIINTIQANGGRFLIRDVNEIDTTTEDDDTDVPLKIASYTYIYEKVSHALRSAKASTKKAPSTMAVALPCKRSISPLSFTSSSSSSPKSKKRVKTRHLSPMIITPAPKARVVNTTSQTSSPKCNIKTGRKGTTGKKYIQKHEDDLEPLPWIDLSDIMKYPKIIEDPPETFVSRNTEQRFVSPDSIRKTFSPCQTATYEWCTPTSRDKKYNYATSSRHVFNSNNNNGCDDPFYMAMDSCLDDEIHAEYNDMTESHSPEPLLDEDLLQVLFNM